MLDLSNSSEFSFWMPMAKAELGGNQYRIRGIASTEDEDLQKEVVLQKGIDYSYFIKYGFINDDHGEWDPRLGRKVKRPIHNVGEPTSCKITPEGFFLEGLLFRGLPRAEEWWQFLQALARSGSNRKAGFSIEGKIQRRDGGTIQKCWIRDVAITASPVNTHTWVEVAKSLSAQSWCASMGGGGCSRCTGCVKSLREHGKSWAAEGSPLGMESLDGVLHAQGPGADRVRRLRRRGYSNKAAREIVAALSAMDSP